MTTLSPHTTKIEVKFMETLRNFFSKKFTNYSLGLGT